MDSCSSFHLQNFQSLRERKKGGEGRGGRREREWRKRVLRGNEIQILVKQGQVLYHWPTLTAVTFSLFFLNWDLFGGALFQFWGHTHSAQGLFLAENRQPYSDWTWASHVPGKWPTVCTILPAPRFRFLSSKSQIIRARDKVQQVGCSCLAWDQSEFNLLHPI